MGGPTCVPGVPDSSTGVGTVASCVTSAAGGGRAEEEGQVPSDMESLSSFWKPVSGTL